MKIERPGLYFDVPEPEYRSDPCAQASITQSLAKIILEHSALHAWYASPKLNPDFKSDNDTKFDLGNIVHAMMLGRGKEIVVLEYDNWMTKKAKEDRILAAADGKLAVLYKHHSVAKKMVAAAREQLVLRKKAYLLSPVGKSEVVMAWKDGSVWARQMLDWLSDSNETVVDVKTTDMSVAPHCLPRMMAGAGWHIQAAMAERGLCKIFGDQRRQFLFVVQETWEPFALNVVEMTEGAMTMGHKMLGHAFDVWEQCISTGRFPGYPLETVKPEFPGWAESQWLEREVQEAARERRPDFDPNIIMAG